MNFIESQPGVYSVIAGGISYDVRTLGDEVTVNGHRFEIKIEDPRQWKRSEDSAHTQSRVAILAPMPGKVVRLLVSVGEEVTAGQGIIVVEAMKMQNELKSPRAGRVTALNAKEHDSVNAGTVLATIG